MNIGNTPMLKTYLKTTTTQYLESGQFTVDMTDNSFHIGRTNVDYKVKGNGTSNTVTFILFSKDGFYPSASKQPVHIIMGLLFDDKNFG